MEKQYPDKPAQTEQLESILRINPCTKRILENADKLALPNWYLGAGCIAQTVWNYLIKKPLTSHINDYDLVYFNAEDLDEESENRIAENVKDLFRDLPVKIDVKNEARVHLWYKEHFGYQIKPYQTIEDAIDTWPTTATCTGVKYSEGLFRVYAPYGLDDMFQMIVRANKRQITEEIYNNKIRRWKECWPELKVIPWQV